jgi:hypothetical protein
VKTCPQCAEEVDDAAPACRSCGRRFNEPSVGDDGTPRVMADPERARSGVIESSSRRQRQSGLGTIAAVSLLVVALACLVGLLGGSALFDITLGVAFVIEVVVPLVILLVLLSEVRDTST